MTQPLVFAQLAKVMAGVGAVGKNKRNPQQGYQFRAVDDVMAALQPIMAEHGIICVQKVLESERDVGQTKSGGAMVSVRLLVEHVFYAADGSHVSCTTLGEASDTSDKASNKAMSAALKYALTCTYMIPTYEVDRDTEDASPEVTAPVQQRQTPTERPKSDLATSSHLKMHLSTLFPGDGRADEEMRVDKALELMGCSRDVLKPKQTVWQLFDTGAPATRTKVVMAAEQLARAVGLDDVNFPRNEGG